MGEETEWGQLPSRYVLLIGFRTMDTGAAAGHLMARGAVLQRTDQRTPTMIALAAPAATTRVTTPMAVVAAAAERGVTTRTALAPPGGLPTTAAEPRAARTRVLSKRMFFAGSCHARASMTRTRLVR
jgi:hypothetical protein